MIGWLKGEIIDQWEQGARKGVVFVCGNIGYEVQLNSRDRFEIRNKKNTDLWIHLVKKEDADSIFGFIDKQERNLFRLLISINGVGPQSALSILEELECSDLIEAVAQQDIRKISQAHGIGKRTAERITIELRDKIRNFAKVQINKNIEASEFNEKELSIQVNIKEAYKTLCLLGYEDFEVGEAISSTSKRFQKDPIENTAELGPEEKRFEHFIKECLIWLSQKAA